METLKKKLEEEKQLLYFKFKESLDQLGLSQEDINDEVEQAVADYNNSHLLRLRNREVIYLKKVDKALKKFEKNEFGLCEDCGGIIKFERLLARGTAELCILCKEDAERSELTNFFGRQSKSLGRTMEWATGARA
jgi:DnaK suppressor protein